MGDQDKQEFLVAVVTMKSDIVAQRLVSTTAHLTIPRRGIQHRQERVPRQELTGNRLVREPAPVRGSAAASGGAQNLVDAPSARVDYCSRALIE
jgi:hypothetical protein